MDAGGHDIIANTVAANGPNIKAVNIYIITGEHHYDNT